MQVLSWLLEAEDHLLSLHSLGQKQLETVSINDDIDLEDDDGDAGAGEAMMTLMTLLMIKIMMMMVQVRQRFYNHEDFMLELQSHQGAVRKVFVADAMLMNNVQQC